MATLATMRQLEERQVELEIRTMVWSPKMDIIAVAFFNGEVALYRLNWQKLWTSSPPIEGSKAVALSWRPDGKLLAVGYDSGDLTLLDIDSNVPIMRRRPDDPDAGGFTCLKWMLAESPAAKKKSGESSPDPWAFLTRLPSLSKAYTASGSGEETELISGLDDEPFSLLISGSDSGKIVVFADGFLKVASLYPFLCENSSKNPKPSSQIDDISVSRDFSTFVVISGCKIMILEMEIIRKCLEEIRILALNFRILDGMVTYMENTLKQIQESWEGILVEMDDKLASYGGGGGPDGMAADFLELLTFGIPSPDLEAFLVQDLTEKGLKKLGHSIEVSYSNVQRLLLKYLHAVSQSMNCALADLRGLIEAAGREKFALMMGLTQDKVVDAQQKAAMFWMKGIELQQVIDESMKSFKAFFRWLYVEILRLTDEDISEELSKMSQQDVRYIAEFLDSFAPSDDDDNDDNEVEKVKSHRNLERVGQYLQDKDLVVPVDRAKNPWHEFLNKNPDVAKIPFIMRPNRTKSLVQEFQVLKESVTKIFSTMEVEVSDKCVIRGDFNHPDVPDNGILKCGQNEWSWTGDCIMFGFIGTVDKIFVYELHPGPDPKLKGLYLTLEDSKMAAGTEIRLIDCQFYTSDTLSLLVSCGETQRMIQMCLADVQQHFREIKMSFQPQRSLPDNLRSVSVFDVSAQACHRELDRINSVQFAVSGPRKVAAFLFENKRRVRVYDMEIDEEEFDEDEEEEAAVSSSELNISY